MNLRANGISTKIRPSLQANTTWYVDNNLGSDTNPGTLASPFKTLLYAWNFVSRYDLNGFGATIQLQDSTTAYIGIYNGTGYGNTNQAPAGIGQVLILGNASDQTKVRITPDPSQGTAFGIYAYCPNVGFRNLTFSDEGRDGVLLVEIGDGAGVNITDCTFRFVGTTASAAMYAFAGGIFDVDGTITLDGSFDYYFWTDPAGHIKQSSNWALVGNPVIRTAFFVNNGGTITLDGSPHIVSGSATGVKISSSGIGMFVTDVTFPAGSTIANIPGSIDYSQYSTGFFKFDLNVGGHINLGSTGTPSAPKDGDLWFDGTNLKFQVGGVVRTVTLQ